MEFRELNPDDYDDMIAVWKKAGLPIKPRGRDSRADIAMQIAFDPEMFLGCFVKGRLAGVIVGSYDSRKGYINRLAVAHEHRRKGIARKLVSMMEKTLKKKGFGIVTSLIEDSTEGSAELFAELGYVKHDDIKYYTKRESDEV